MICLDFTCKTGAKTGTTSEKNVTVLTFSALPSALTCFGNDEIVKRDTTSEKNVTVLTFFALPSALTCFGNDEIVSLIIFSSKFALA